MDQSNVVEQLSANTNQLAKHAIHVHKFGGSSLASPKCVERVVDIIKSNCHINDLVVVSANGDTTDALFNLLENESLESVEQTLDAIKTLQQELIDALLNPSSAARLNEALTEDLKQISQWLLQDRHRYQADILAFGEVWSARLLSAKLGEQVCPSYMIDARDFLVIDNEQSCVVDIAKSEPAFSKQIVNSRLAIITGYISRDIAGKTCTLGRNGSDYSATIVAMLAGASDVTLWTDVDGIYSADPRVVPLARKLHRIHNGVAKELGRLGNPVLHAKTLKPLENLSAHLHVASSFDPQISGTEIGKFGQIAKQEVSVTYLNDLILARSTSLEGKLGAQAEEQFDVICADTTLGFVVIHQSQQKSLSQWHASHDTEMSFTPVSILAAVGHNIIHHGGVKARFKRALKHSKTLQIVDAKSEHSLIAILPQACTPELLNNVHHDLTKDARHIGLVVAGLGNIGQKFLEMLPDQLSQVSALENVHLVGLLSSKKALINTDGIDINKAIERFESDGLGYDHDLLMSWLANHPYDELIVVDITPSEAFSQLYLSFFQEGIHVIGANKWAASAPQAQYNELCLTAEKNKSIWLGNTTVGAGLPINYAITDLLNSGDSINEVSGVFSGTLSWLFARYDGSQPFSQLMLDALSQGITEPDPREDLSGRDVQRKLLILARAAGYQLSLEDIDCQNLVPEALRAISLNDFLAQSELLDEFFATQLAAAKSEQCCIRYVAKFEEVEGKLIARVGLAQYPQNDPLAQLTAGDNIFVIRSQWYNSNPLIIQGPGAGRDVTAGGLHSDLVTICQQLSTIKNQVKIKGEI